MWLLNGNFFVLLRVKIIKREKGWMNMDDKWLVGVDLGGIIIKMVFINYYGEIIYKWEINMDVSE